MCNGTKLVGILLSRVYRPGRYNLELSIDINHKILLITEISLCKEPKLVAQLVLLDQCILD